MNNLKISTNELAKICGVSQGTVDMALNNRPGISVRTKEKIIKTAILYGYRPQKSRVKLIGIIVFNLRKYFSPSLKYNNSYAQCKDLRVFRRSG